MVDAVWVSLNTVGAKAQWCRANHSLITTMENPRGHQVGRMGKAVVMMMMMSMYMETTQVWSGSRDLALKLGSPVATAAS